MSLAVLHPLRLDMMTVNMSLYAQLKSANGHLDSASLSTPAICNYSFLGLAKFPQIYCRYSKISENYLS